MYRKILFPLLFMLSALAACIPLVGTLQVGVETPTSPEPHPTESNSSMLTPEATRIEEPVAIPANGTTSGRVCYSSEFVPAMTAYFQAIPRGNLTEIIIAENQTSYVVELAPGTYRAFAWVEDYQLGGAYTAYVACGYAETCTDHALQSFEVKAGQQTANIDLCDWPLLAEHLPLPHSSTDNTNPLAGLIYSTQEGTHFQIGKDGNTTNIFSKPGMVIAPDRMRGLYAENNDLHILNLLTGETFNLTNSPDMVEILYQWPLDDQIFFTAVPAHDEIGPGMTGGLYRLNPDGADLTVIDADTNVANFAVSPNGRFVAYGAGRTAYIYDLELNQRGVFDPAVFGLPNSNGAGVTSPAWSPDGQKIAWITQGDFYGQGAFAVVIFDLTATTFEIIHPYQIVGMDGFLPPVKFSPDGKWIVFQAFEQDFARYGVWVASVGNPNGSIKMFLGAFSSNPFWSPTGGQIAFQQFIEAEQGQRVFLYDLENNAILQLPALSLNVSIIDW